MQEQYIKSENNYTYQPKQQQLQPPISLMTTSSSYEHSGDKEFERLKVKLQSLQIDLNLRNQVIENLSELITLHSNERNLTVMSSRNDGFIDIPSNYLQLFQNMNKDLKAKTLELDQTKKRLEAIITSMSMNPQKSVRIYNGEYNEEDVAHKIVKKLSILQQENDSLLEMISSGNKMSLIIELGILRDENERLKKELEIKQNK